MSQIEVPDWVAEAIRSAVVAALNDRNQNMEGYAYFSKNMGVPESEFDDVADAVIPTLTAVLGAWVVPSHSVTNGTGPTATLYTLRQEKPE